MKDTSLVGSVLDTRVATTSDIGPLDGSPKYGNSEKGLKAVAYTKA